MPAHLAAAMLVDLLAQVCQRSTICRQHVPFDERANLGPAEVQE